MPITCLKKRSLLIAWQATTEAHSMTVTELMQNIDNLSADQYDRVVKEICRTCTLSADAREGYEVHAKEHGC